MRIRDWSSDVCSSDLAARAGKGEFALHVVVALHAEHLVDHVAVFRQRQEAGIVLADGVCIETPLDARQHCRFALAGELIALEKRSEERRVGTECVGTCRARGLPYNYNKKKAQQ